jgi:hypothetical protein
MGLERFTEALEQYLSEEFAGIPISAMWGDPATEQRDQVYEFKVRECFTAHGWPFRSAPTQDVATRVDAIRNPCTRLVAGKPGLLVNTRRAPRVHKALSGAWFYRRVQVTGVERFEQKPCKNEFSHPAEALGYLLCGGGEAKVARPHLVDSMGRPARRGSSQAKVEFDVYG